MIGSTSYDRRHHRLVAAATTMAAAAVGILVLATTHAYQPSHFRGLALPPKTQSDELLTEYAASSIEPWNMTVTILSPGRKQSIEPFERLGKGNCAVIGSGPNTKGKGYGPTIDGYDTVIRVNRLPRPMDYHDLGKKTDVITMNNNFIHYDRGTGIFSPSTWAGYVGGVVVDCHTPGVCDFDAVVFQYAQGASAIMWDVVGSENFWGSLRQTVGRENDDFHGALECLDWPDKMMLSSGFGAVMLFLPLCQTMKTYGFGGSGTFDSHIIDFKHSFEIEHGLMRKMAQGNISANDFRNTSTCTESKSKMLAWMRRNMDKLKGRFSMQL